MGLFCVFYLDSMYPLVCKEDIFHKQHQQINSSLVKEEPKSPRIKEEEMTSSLINSLIAKASIIS